MSKWIDKKINSFIENADIPKEDVPIIKYGLRQGFKSITGFGLAVIVGVLMRISLQGILFMISYILLRIYAGGYHADTEKKCAVLSAISVIGAYLLIKFGLDSKAFVLILSIICLIVLCVFTPVDNPQNIISKKEKKLYKKIAIVLALIYMTICGITSFMEFYSWARCMQATLLVTSINVITGYMKYK